ncbi:hypothetical protein HPB51_007485 [Rhipicephalus microplus]|uniref:Uncharacterized protein n=1 Tax=Rhipicephalus microplus TaxID=6941 RepID=A0A9J6D4C1_RHIMP|nr:hypothetical protein HPB51_007485 [Rhipicephalus microplus]
MSLAMSLVGDPALVILDECTSGVDPISRGRLFRAITRIQRSSGMAVLFTSHCMRECDQLCTRVGILSGGDFTRVGDTVALKQSATQGCTIVVKLTVEQSVQDGSIKEINRGIKREFPQSVIAEKREVSARTSSHSDNFISHFAITLADDSVRGPCDGNKHKVRQEAQGK